ncbi:MAG: hypothetical protein ACRDV6_01025 [Acidimicrobiales bacterium]
MSTMLAACSSGGTTGSISGISEAKAAVIAYENVNGPPDGTWKIAGIQASTVDSSYVLFRIAPKDDKPIQGGYGFVHEQSRAWKVIGFGSAEVGCPPGASDNRVVPSAVLSGFGLTCPNPG